MTDQRILVDVIERLTYMIRVLDVEAFEQEGFSELSRKQLLYLETIARLKSPSYSDLAGNIYIGVCNAPPAGKGFCAEHSAAAAMINAGESHIKTTAVVGIEDEIACVPCGRCREFLNALHSENFKCEVLLENGDVKT